MPVVVGERKWGVICIVVSNCNKAYRLLPDPHLSFEEYPSPPECPEIFSSCALFGAGCPCAQKE